MTPKFDLFFRELIEAFTPFTGDSKVDAARLGNLNRGSAIEKSFLDIMFKHKFSVREATPAEERNHIDFFVELKPGVVKSFEVKPRLEREELYAIELVGRQGYPGSIYGEADYLAFNNPTDRSFYIIKRKKLKDVVEKVGGVSVKDRWGNLSTDNFKTVDQITDASLIKKLFYYRRSASGANDPSILTTISVRDMAGLSEFTFK